MTRPDTDAIDTRGSPAQLRELRSAIEVAHGARVAALEEAARECEKYARELERNAADTGPFGLLALAKVIRALAQSGAAEKGEGDA